MNATLRTNANKCNIQRVGCKLRRGNPRINLKNFLNAEKNLKVNMQNERPCTPVKKKSIEDVINKIKDSSVSANECAKQPSVTPSMSSSSHEIHMSNLHILKVVMLFLKKCNLSLKKRNCNFISEIINNLKMIHNLIEKNSTSSLNKTNSPTVNKMNNLNSICILTKDTYNKLKTMEKELKQKLKYMI